MKLNELLKYDKITIQCHDNPDPDALASAYGLFRYFESKGKSSRIIYGGRSPIQKANIRLMMDELGIEAEYIKDKDIPVEGLLITVDCQYKEGNVTPYKADDIAIIDHHQSTGLVSASMDMTEIHPYLGSCSTLVWKMLKEEGYDIDADKKLGTALYYGLMTDTGNFVEVHHPLDRDMMDVVVYDKILVRQFCNSNISLDELRIAGVALMKYEYDEKRRFTLIGAEPCDPNILGLISDLALQVDTVDCNLVYNETPDGYKFSVRSCIKEVHASDFAEFLARQIGSGGGHTDKAGGFISKSKLERVYGTSDAGDYFQKKVAEYFDNTEIIYAAEYDLDTSDMKEYAKKRLVVGYADPADFLPVGTEVTIRTLEGDVNNVVTGDYYIMIGIIGEVYPITKAKFKEAYNEVNDSFNCDLEYVPTIRSKNDGIIHSLMEYAHSCQAKAAAHRLAKQLDHPVKIFTEWDEDNYYLGNTGDFIMCNINDCHDIYIVKKDIFYETYEPV